MKFIVKSVRNLYENTYKMIVWYINHIKKCVSWSKMIILLRNEYVNGLCSEWSYEILLDFIVKSVKFHKKRCVNELK